MPAFRELNAVSILLNHRDSVAKLYKDNFYDKRIQSASLNGVLFDINTPYDYREDRPEIPPPKKRKRVKTAGLFDEITAKVSDNLNSIKCKLGAEHEKHEQSNKPALEFVDHFNLAFTYNADSCFNGRNTSEQTVFTELDGESFLVPPNVTFFNAPISRFNEYLPESEKFDLIVLDPPWWNKYIRRVKGANARASYRMLANEDIAQIPLERHLHGNTIVIVWCTNAPSHIDAIASVFFPKWGLETVGAWYWTKITKKGDPVCRFKEPNGKQPYERLFIGLPPGSSLAKSIPKELFLYSIPSALHSHKPPLYELIRTKFALEAPNCLELFARSLHSGCTSFGMEVLKLQNKRLYELAEVE
ncbi:N(6)-adenine-specific methyltransferase METTL4 [Anopheles aquasalis]|uniref:N(6)-adenine-specific methyltransferase METTL4 n=1 Tax=Anopheles aquasalis TaxID=42839 RepID=UPI00215B249E|nr:N(6)-adenine-specific methyltransferase METTL4 [Anopheles aquasalis]